MIMLSKCISFVKNDFNDIISPIIVILISLFSFACGFLTAKYYEKEPIIIEEISYEKNSSQPYSFIS